jgi:hypothetical protein
LSLLTEFDLRVRAAKAGVARAKAKTMRNLVGAIARAKKPARGFLALAKSGDGRG